MIATDEFYCTGTKEEVEQYQRKLDFDGENIESYYRQLTPDYKKCVYEVLKKLADGRDFFGYNLKQFLKAHKEFHVSQRRISKTLDEDTVEYLSEKEFEDFYFSGKDGMDINNMLNSAKKTIDLNKGTATYKFVRTVCDYFSVDMELLLTGIGRTYSIKEEWSERFWKDAEFQKKAEEEPSETWNMRRRMGFFEDYLKEKGELNSDDTVILTEWAVMANSGLYLMLKQKKGMKQEAEAIKCLIMQLYLCQLKDGKAPVNYEYIEE